MTQGAPDYTHLRQILARDADGNLVPVACDPSGRIILLPYGTQTVEQDDPIRTIQGADGLTLHTIAVDAAGRLIMLPYGWDGATYRPLKVDDEGRMIGIMKGQADVKWGLRLWYKFIPAEGTTIRDYSGYGNDGSALSGVGAEAKYEDGVIGQALKFDGIDDYVDCGDDGSIEITGVVTYEAWVRFDALPGDIVYILSHSGVDEGCYLLRIGTLGVINFTRWTGVGNAFKRWETTTLHLTALTWHHVVAVYDGTDTTLYLDGVSESPVSSDGNFNPNAYNTRLAQWHTTYTAGQLDEVRIYARSLSADEVAWRYANTNPAVGKPTRMIAVDNEGRMEVNLKDLPYKDQVLERFQLICTPAGNYNLQSSIVPQGKLWVINVCNAYVDTAAIDTIDIGIYDGSDNFIVAYEYGTGLVGWVNIQTPLILKAGDRVNAGYVAVGNNGVINLVVNGYELDAP